MDTPSPQPSDPPPFQFGLGSLFVLTAGVGIVAAIRPPPLFLLGVALLILPVGAGLLIGLLLGAVVDRISKR